MTETWKVPSTVCSDFLTEALRGGAQCLLAEAVRIAAEQWIAARTELVDDQGRRPVVRNGYLPQRQVLTGIGPVAIRPPRVAEEGDSTKSWSPGATRDAEQRRRQGVSGDG